jgi:hypothetical protein
VLRALRRLLGLGRDQLQLSLGLDARPRDAAELSERLRQLGLDRRYNVRLTSNRTVFVSYSADELRLHRGYLDAPDETWQAIVDFVRAKTRRARNAARQVLLAYPVHRGERQERSARPRSTAKTHPDNAAMVERLRRAHESLNRESFGGVLNAIPIRVSRRMKSRLGHYTHRGPSGDGGEIVISRRHIRRHGWGEAMETLLHEMVHQWQDESGMAADHGRHFKAKARAVGISPRARRDVA